MILGGGFGGAYAAKQLRKTLPKGWEFTLIDRNNFLLFYPLLVDAGVGSWSLGMLWCRFEISFGIGISGWRRLRMWIFRGDMSAIE